MNYIKYTYVDSVTGIPVTDEPAANGPTQPDIGGLEFGFALESQYPTSAPIFYGTTDDEANTDIPGVIEVVTEDEYNEALSSEMTARQSIAYTRDAQSIVDKRFYAETSGIIWGGVFIDTERDSQTKLQSARSAAKEGLRKDDAIWKCGDPETGLPVYRPTSNDEMIDIADKVYDYIQACYDREGALMAALESGTYAGEMLADGWPWPTLPATEE